MGTLSARNGDDEFDEMVYLSIRRSIRELFGRFGEIILVLKETTEIKVKNALKVINNLVEHYRLSEEQKEQIIMSFGSEPEHDKYGIANAVTRGAQTEENWERSIEMERIGGKVITLPAEEFKKLTLVQMQHNLRDKNGDRFTFVILIRVKVRGLNSQHVFCQKKGNGTLCLRCQYTQG